MRVVLVLGVALLLAAVPLQGCAPKPAPAVRPAPSPVATIDPGPPASPAATLMEASCVRMGSVPMQTCSCWSRRVAAGVSPDIAAAYGIQNVAKRADAMTALKPEQMQAFVAASDAAEAACTKRK